LADHNPDAEELAQLVKRIDRHRRARALNCGYGQGFLFSRRVDEEKAMVRKVQGK